MPAPLPEYTISVSYSSDRHEELVRWALRADQLLPVCTETTINLHESGSALI